MKTLVFLLFSSFLTGAAFNSTTPKESADAQVSRQCCSYLVDLGGGLLIEATACSGWLLSDDTNSMARACEKARDAAQDLLN